MLNDSNLNDHDSELHLNQDVCECLVEAFGVNVSSDQSGTSEDAGGNTTSHSVSRDLVNHAIKDSTNPQETLSYLNKYHEQLFEPISPKSKLNKRIGHKNLDAALVSLLGQANLFKAQKKFKDAITIYLELIRQSPYFYEAYLSLGYSFEELGKRSFSMKFFVIAAHLKPDEFQLWEKIVEYFISENDLRSAVRCCNYALKKLPYKFVSDYEKWPYIYVLSVERIRCYNALQLEENWRNALRFHAIHVVRENSSLFVQTMRVLVQSYVENNELFRAIEIYEMGKIWYSSCLSLDDFVNLLSLYCRVSSYYRVFDTLRSHFAIAINTECSYEQFSPLSMLMKLVKNLNQSENYEYLTFTSITNYEHLDVRLVCYLISALLHIGKIELAHSILVKLLADNLKNFHAYLIELGIQFLKKHVFRSALSIFLHIVPNEVKDSIQQFSSVVHLAEAFAGLSNYQSALAALDKIKEFNAEVRLIYSDICFQSHYFLRAIEILECSSPTEFHHLLAMRTALVIQNETTTLSYLLRGFRYLINSYKLYRKTLSSRQRAADHPRMYFDNEKFCYLYTHSLTQHVKSVFTMFYVAEIFSATCKLLLENNKIFKMLTLITACISSKFLSKYISSSRFILFCLRCNLVYNVKFKMKIRTLLELNINSIPVWTLFSLLLKSIGLTCNSRRMVSRILQNNRSPLVSLVFASTHHATVRFRMCLSLYGPMYMRNPRDASLNFNLSICFLNCVTNRLKTETSKYFILALYFMKSYHRLRGLPIESLYNLGRLYHQFGILPQAIELYKEALMKDGHTFSVCLKREVAYNLSRIYLHSGSQRLACQIMKEYLCFF